jgi:ribosomal protein S18 acetylase RimI-like enzyme
MLIRPARPGEYARIGELTARVYLDGRYTRTTSPYLARLRDAAARAEQAELLVATDDDGTLLGSVTFAAGGSPYAETATGPQEAGFRMLVVDPAARGRGVGEALVLACLDLARAGGAHIVRLSTQPEMHAAHRLYERLGFRRTPELDWTPEPQVRLITYALELGDPGEKLR